MLKTALLSTIYSLYNVDNECLQCLSYQAQQRPIKHVSGNKAVCS